MSDFSSNLRRLRKRTGLSQDALAEKLSVTRQTVSSWERGNSYPDLDMLVHISDALATEDANGSAAQTYANIIAVRAGDENSPKTQALLKALKTDAVKQYIADTYNGAVVASF